MPSESRAGNSGVSWFFGHGDASGRLASWLADQISQNFGLCGITSGSQSCLLPPCQRPNATKLGTYMLCNCNQPGFT
jgi:hypothetical protein